MDDRTRRRLADVERKRAELAAQIDALDAEEQMLLETALRAWRDNPGPAVRRGLRKVNTPRSVNSSMEMAAEHKIAISKGRAAKDPFLAACRAAGYTMRGLAGRLGIPASMLSMYRSADAPRPIPRDRADQIETLTGWKATAAHWPGGFA